MKRESSFRKMTFDDLEIVLAWRNSKRIRENMIHDHVIAMDEHKTWFSRIDQDKRYLYLLYEIDMQPVGLVYFTNIERVQGSCFWGFYVGDENQPKGTGYSMCSEALSFAFNELKLQRINSEVLTTNIRSINLHKRLGFTKTAEKVVDFKKIYQFSLSKKEWLKTLEG